MVSDEEKTPETTLPGSIELKGLLKKTGRRPNYRRDHAKSQRRLESKILRSIRVFRESLMRNNARTKKSATAPRIGIRNLWRKKSRKF